MCVSRFEVGIHRQLHGGCDLRDVLEHHLSWNGPVRVRQRTREGEPGTCGRERPKAEMTKIARRAGVPGIRDDETSAFMQLAELITARGEVGRDHSGSPRLSQSMFPKADARSPIRKPTLTLALRSM